MLGGDEMAIFEKEVEVTIHNKTINYYEDLGYKIKKYKDVKHNLKERVKRGTKIIVKIDHLSPKSCVIVTKVCDNCGRKQNHRYCDVLLCRNSGNGKDYCKKCSGIKISSSKKEKVRKSLLDYATKNDMCYLINEFSDKNKKTPSEISYGSANIYIWNCSKCSSDYETKVNTRTSGSMAGCPYCAGLKVNHTNCLQSKNPNLSNEWNKELNHPNNPENVYYKSRNKYWWNCNKGHDPFFQELRSRHERNSGCPACMESKGENKIRSYLVEFGFIFQPQKEFDGLKGIGNGLLSYDFYLPDENILIEYQGEFHDGKMGGNFTKVNLEKQQEHDKRKSEYAKRNNIKLIQIWYWDFDNIETILEKELIKGGI